MKFVRHSPSSLNLFRSCREMFILEKIIGRRQPVGAPAHRGTAVEEGVAFGLDHPEANMTDLLVECVAVAHKKYDSITALSHDARREEYRATIPAMITGALLQLRDYGKPSAKQGYVEWKPEGLKYPIVGYFDFYWEETNTTVDLKTSGTLPSSVKIPHAQQVALYVTSNNADARICYVTPKKNITYRIDNIDAHRDALYRTALACERWLAQSEDPQFFVDTTAPDYESFYWNGPARQIGFEVWGF